MMAKPNENFADMPTKLTEVVSDGFCIGCGSCAFSLPEAISMKMSRAGHWQPLFIRPLSEKEDMHALKRCPMSGRSLNEDELAGQLFPLLPVHAQLGRVHRNLVGHVQEGDFRIDGGSGGMVSWILCELLRLNEVDAVIHVRPSDEGDCGPLLFKYAISGNEAEVRQGAKSRYYPIELSEVLRELADTKLRYAVVGLPCFIKAIRVLQVEGVISRERTPYCIGLVCGHLKSKHFASYLAWQKGIDPNDLTGFDFRRKIPGRPASKYAFAAKRVDIQSGRTFECTHPMETVQGRDWGEGLTKNPACEYCDDVMAECADIAIGDAWLPGHVNDWRGTNVVTIRDARIDQMISKAQSEGRLALGPISAKEVARSQGAGLRHRREGLAHRLMRRKEAGMWSPRKRVSAKLADGRRRQHVYDLRLQIALRSSDAMAEALEAGDRAHFEAAIKPLAEAYRRVAGESLIRRGLRKLKYMVLDRWSVRA